MLCFRSNLLNIVLLMGCLVAPAVLADSVQGVVKNENGVGIAGVTVSLTGALVGSQPDVITDVSGAYSATVPADTYRIVYSPPAAAGVVPERLTGVAVAGAIDLGDRILFFGVDVTGLVTDPLANPIAGVDLRFADLATGKTIYTPSDDTDASGHYAVFVPPGSYKVEFRPPVLVDLAPVVLEPIQITAAGALPTVVLPDGVVVIGAVRDELGAAVEDVDLDFIDVATGDKIFTTRDDTNEFGLYRTVVEPGTYDIRYLPPATSGLISTEVLGVALSVDVTLPDVVLVSGMQFSGRVVNDQGIGLANVDLNVFDAITGEQLLTPDDDTDASGFYQLPLVPGTYDVRYTPPAGPPYLPQLFEAIVITADVVRPDVVLPLGFLVSGKTVDHNLQPVSDVDLDFKDLATNTFIYVARDDSDIAGNFAVAVPGATYRIDFDPPEGTIFLPLSLPDVAIVEDLPLGNVVLPQLWMLTGVVQDDVGSPLAGVNFEIRDSSTGEALALDDNLTDGTGSFIAMVPPGTYRIFVEAPAGSPFFPLLTDPVAVEADIDVGVLAFERGVYVSGVVVDTAGGAVAGVTVRFQNLAGGMAVETLTDISGNFQLLLEPGSYEIRYEPMGLPLLNLVVGPLLLDVDTIVPRAVLQPAYFVSGRAVDDLALGIAGIDVDLLDDATGVSLRLQNDVTGADGSFAVKTGPGIFRLRLEPDPESGFFELETEGFSIPPDINLGDLTLPRAVTIEGEVIDDQGKAARNVGVDFLPEPTNQSQETVSVSTNGNGRFSAVVPQGDFRLRFDPPINSPYFEMIIGPLEFLADTTLATVVLDRGMRVSGTVIDAQQIQVPGVDVDLLDAVTGQSIPLENDLTDATGRFDVLAPAGSYNIRLEPDPATRLLPLVTSPVAVGEDVDVGNLMLGTGMLLSGDVIDVTAAAIEGVSIKVSDSVSGIDLLLVGDRTDSAGAFMTSVPPGEYFVEYRPPAGSAYVAERIGPVTVNSDVVLPPMTLMMGTRVSGVVLNSGLAPAPDVDTVWRLAGTCDVVFTVRDRTDLAGRYEVILPPANYDATLAPMPTDGLIPERIPAVSVAGSETIVPTYVLSATASPIESCNGVDDDCDGIVDNGCTIPGSSLVVERNTLSWDSVAAALSYDVVRGDLGTLLTGAFTSSVLTCLVEDTTDTLLNDTAVPASGQGFWMLLRPNTAAGPGSFGDGRRDTSIAASALTCSP